MSSLKIFNDPVYGFITVPEGIVLDLVNHPYFQRLRRIMQLGFTHLVYPGAVHSRFHHALGALHLMTNALDMLRLKHVEISPEEYEATQIAILLHDVGHGPFSHVLEGSLVPVDHEVLTEWIMHRLNKEYHGKLNLAIDIFQDKYPRKFFNILISSQLDVDRMDYLNRDSFYTGVAEGVIGYDRILKMIDVVDDQLVVEEKALYSIEKYLIARRIMYWQVYMHKTAIAAETMLFAFLHKTREQELTQNIDNQSINYFLGSPIKKDQFVDREKLLDHFLQIDDNDIIGLLKKQTHSSDHFTRSLAENLLFRRLLKIKISDKPLNAPIIQDLILKSGLNEVWEKGNLSLLVKQGVLEMSVYNYFNQEIFIKNKDKTIKPLSELLDLHLFSHNTIRYYLTFPPDFKNFV